MKKIFIILIFLSFFGVAVSSAMPKTAESATIKTGNTTGLIAYWSFDEGTSTRATDFSGHGNNGTLSGATKPAWVSGKHGGALSFNGTTAYVNLPPNFGMSSGFSVTAWIKDTGAAYQDIFDFLDSNNDGFEGVAAGSPNGEKFYVRDKSNHTVFGPAISVKDNKWHFITMTYLVASNLTTVYTDAVVGASSATLTNIPTTFSSSTIAKINSGAWYNGFIDDVRIYNRALSASEVQALYKSGETVVNKIPVVRLNKGLVGYWSFDGNTIANGAIRDLSGNGNTGYPTNISTSTFYASGKIGQSIRADGVNDWIRVADAVSIQNIWDNGGTVSFWINPITRGGGNAGFIIDKSAAVGWTIFGFDAASAGQTGFEFNVSWSGGVAKWKANTTPAITLKKWHHVVISYNSSSTSNNPTLYVDGVLSSLPVFVSPSGTRSSDVGGVMEIGGNASASRASNAFIDDMRVYNRALSPAEINALYRMGGASINKTPVNRLNQGLVGYWTFDGKDTVSNISDVSGNGNKGLILPTSATSSMKVTGKIGQGLKFDGLTNSVYVANSASLPFTNNQAWTVSQWVYMTKAEQDKGFTSQWQTSPQKFWYIGYRSSLTRWQFQITDGTQTPYSVYSDASPLNKWVHLVGVYDGDKTAKLYLNGVLGQVYPADSAPSYQNDRTFFIGGDSNRGASSYLQGKMDEVRVYNRALSSAEVKQLYNMGR